MTLNPLFDFFYPQYNMLTSLAQLAIKIGEIVYQGTRTLVDWIVKIIDFLL